MKISVAMTVYNGERFIKEQLDSIRTQSLKPDEVIICDDQSNDRSFYIVDNYIRQHKLDNEWKLIRNDKQIGFVENFHKVIDLTTGDYIFLSDQDDVFYPNKFQKMYEFMLKHEDCMLLNGNFEPIDEESKVINSIRSMNNHRVRNVKKIDFRNWLFESKFPGFSMCIRREIRERLSKANWEQCFGHDLLIGLIAIDLNGNYEISDILSGYRSHESNVTSDKNFLNDYHIEVRIKQKMKELHEYDLLDTMINNNNIRNVDHKYFDRRKDDLKKRIKCLEERSILRIIKMILICRTYPKGTLIGDLIFVIKDKRAHLRLVR